jgi:hypothetical protein
MRAWLKSFGPVYALNSFVKDLRLSRQASRIRRSYEAKVAGFSNSWSDAAVAQMLRRRMQADSMRMPGRPGPATHIYCVGTYYDHEAAGFLQSLERVARLSLFHNADGVYGLNAPRGMNLAQARLSHARCLVEHVQACHREHPVSFLIGTMNLQNLPLEALAQVRAMGIPVVNIAMDDRLPEHWRKHDGGRIGAIGLAGAVDLTVNTTREYVPRYLAEGCPAIHWPFASDPELFKPAAQRDLDVVFVGNKYGKRKRLVDSIEAAGIRIQAFGKGFRNGHLAGDRVPDLFGRAKIVLGTGLVGHSSRVTTLKLRDFDGPMSGALYLTTESADLVEHYDIGREIVVYRDVRDCIGKIRFYLDNHAERESIGEAGRMRAVRDHTWDARISKIFELFSG